MGLRQVLIKLVYTLFLIIGLLLLVYLSWHIIHEKDKTLISSLVILISAFLATISVQLSIKSSQKISYDEQNRKKETTLLHLLYLMNSLKYSLREFEITYGNIDSYLIANPNEEIEYSLYVNYKPLLMKDNQNLTRHLHFLENPDLLYEVNTKVSSAIITICLSLSSIIKTNNLLVSYEKLEREPWNYHVNFIREFDNIIVGKTLEIEELITEELPKNKLFNNIFLDILNKRA